MNLTRVTLYTVPKLTLLTLALTLAGCGGKIGDDLSATAEATISPASERWGTPVRMRDWISAIGGTCDSFDLLNDEIASCGNDVDGYYFLAQNSTGNPTAADGNRGAFMAEGNPLDAEMVWGDDWSIVCYGGRVVENCARVKASLGMEYSSHRVGASADEWPVDPSTSPVPTASSSSGTPESTMDGIYADVLQGEGIDVAAGDIARASTAACDALDAGAGQDEALDTVEEATGRSGWQATRILQAGVLSRCSQYVDSTY